MKQWQRYQRQMLVEQIGLTGQSKLAQAKVLVIGCGGLASSLLNYLAAAGIGHIGIVDDDKVALTNLQRQILFTEEDVEQAKVNVAKKHLKKLNSTVTIKIYNLRLDQYNAKQLLRDYHIIADCTDNFASRYLINKVCYQLQKPFVFACAEQFSGQTAIFSGQYGPCYQCLYPTTAKQVAGNCNQTGIVGPVLGVLGSLQANMIFNYFLNINFAMQQLIFYDGLQLQFSTMQLHADTQCTICHGRQQSKQETLHQQQRTLAISNKQLKQLTEYVLLDIRNDYQRQYYAINAKHIPYAALTERYTELSRQQMIIVVCQYGNTSQQAATFLRTQGFKKTFYLEQGIMSLVRI